MATYSLPGFTTVGGTINAVTITSSVAGLTTPTAQTITNIGDIEEDVEWSAYVHDYGTCEIEIVDDYSTHSEGFWWKLLESDADARILTRFQITYTDDGSSRELYWGRPAANGIVWKEHRDNGSGTYIRTARILLEPDILKLKEATIANVRTRILGKTKYYGNVDIETSDPNLRSVFLKVTDVIQAIVQEAGFAFSGTINGQDIGYKVDGVYKNINDCWMFLGRDDTAHATIEYRGYLDSGTYPSTMEDYAWLRRFQSGWDLLNHLLRCIGYTARFDLQGSGAHVLVLYSKRRALGTTVTMSGKAFQSEARSADDLTARSIHVWKTTNPPRTERAADSGSDKAETFYGENAWAIETYHYRSGAVSSAAAAEDEPLPRDPNDDSDQSVDLELEQDFNIDPGSTGIFYKNHAMLFYLDNPAGSPTEYDVNYFTNIRYYSYQSAGWSSDYSNSVECFRDYLWDLYRMPRRLIERTYDSMECDNGTIVSQHALHPYVRISINQGDATRTFYAKRVVKNVGKNTAIVEWLQE